MISSGYSEFKKRGIKAKRTDAHWSSIRPADHVSFEQSDHPKGVEPTGPRVATHACAGLTRGIRVRFWQPRYLPTWTMVAIIEDKKRPIDDYLWSLPCINRSAKTAYPMHRTIAVNLAYAAPPAVLTKDAYPCPAGVTAFRHAGTYCLVLSSCKILSTRL